MDLSDLPLISAEQIQQTVSYADAIASIETALHDGFDPAVDPQRSAVEAGRGHLLLMPSTVGAFTGVKVASVAPDNPARGRPRIQGVYVLMDAETLSPVALLDGTALTTVRTPAVSAVAVRHLASQGPLDVVVFGSGPQAHGHVEALSVVRDLRRVTVVGRDQERATAFRDRLRTQGVDADVGGAEVVSTADVVVCATSAGEPLFDGRAIGVDSCVVAIGSHEPDRRELPSDLVSRAQVVVEDVATALREAGDIAVPVAEGGMKPEALVGLADLIRGAWRPTSDRPRVFKGVGMSWQDVVVATTAYAALEASR